MGERHDETSSGDAATLVELVIEPPEATAELSEQVTQHPLSPGSGVVCVPPRRCARTRTPSTIMLASPSVSPVAFVVTGCNVSAVNGSFKIKVGSVVLCQPC